MSTYICNICHKSFNSNQHLKQHKNKKNPCYNANISIKQPELDLSVLGSLQNTYLSEFIITYQKLLIERDATNKLIEEYKYQKAELFNENKLLKNKLKSISQIINNSNKNNNYDSDDSSNIHNKLISPLITNSKKLFELNDESLSSNVLETL